LEAAAEQLQQLPVTREEVFVEPKGEPNARCERDAYHQIGNQIVHRGPRPEMLGISCQILEIVNLEGISKMSNYWIDRYNEAAARVQKHSPDAIGGGAVTHQEIERLEKLAGEYESRALEAARNTPSNLAQGVLAGLGTRAEDARRNIVEIQAEIQQHKRELSILGMPADYLVAPPPAISVNRLSFKTLEEQEDFNTEFAHTVADLEMRATKLKNYCRSWTRLTFEQQTRELLMAHIKRSEN
jgi:hypothetical protein